VAKCPLVLHAQDGHDRAGPLVLNQGLGKDPLQPDFGKAVPDQLTGAFSGEALPPTAAQQSVTEFGLSLDRSLFGTLGRLQQPQPDERPVDGARPPAEPGHL
jgi:hypothetical protein